MERATGKISGQKTILSQKICEQRDMQRLPVKIKEGVEINLSPGDYSDLIRAVIEQFAQRFVPEEN